MVVRRRESSGSRQMGLKDVVDLSEQPRRDVPQKPYRPSPVHVLKGHDFGCLLSHTVVHTVVGVGSADRQRSNSAQGTRRECVLSPAIC